MKYRIHILLVLCVAATLFVSCEPRQDAKPLVHAGMIDRQVSQESLVAAASQPTMPKEPEESVFAGSVASGNTAASILKPWLSPADVHAVSSACKPVFDLKKIQLGKSYRVVSVADRFVRFEYAIDAERSLEVLRNGASYTASIRSIDLDAKVEVVTGVIRTSLYSAMAAAGEQPSLAVRLGNLFGWEIDFIRDLRVGDTFSVLVEKRYAGGTFKGYGQILAAEFVNGDIHHEAYRMEGKDGSAQYYTQDGRNLRHAFLKAPVAFARISSGFSLHRFHPIQNYYKPHYGVDYAASPGTPIYAIGSGTLKRVATDQYSGKHIMITHNNGYESGYLHMSRFASGMRTGKKVEQGDLIGYVGSTGLATGPHLCFRMKFHGKPVDPTKIDVPRSGTIPERQREAFARIIAEYHPLLNPHYAKNDPRTDNQGKG